MKEIRATFTGTDRSLGYRRGKTYHLLIEENTIVSPIECPYGSVESFLDNWRLE